MSSARATAVLLVNLGTPDAPTAPAIRRYLRQFLSDIRVVRLPRILWLPVLYGFILPFRPARLVHAYRKVWTAQGSPLMVISREQQAALQQLLGADTTVRLAMTYGQPSIASQLEELQARNIDRLMILPLYPQYSTSTTAAVYDQVLDGVNRWHRVPELVAINDYHDQPGYVAALAESVREHRRRHGAGEHLLVSFHSIPQSYVDDGDPYQRQCEVTAALLAQALGLDEDAWSISYQSRLGRQPWLQPYTDIVLPQLAARGVRSLDVICPGFAADCLETLEEVAIRYRELYLGSGGTRFSYVPALNAQPAHIVALREVLDAPRAALPI